MGRGSARESRGRGGWCVHHFFLQSTDNLLGDLVD
jgi:hypothetical protein